MSTKTVVVVGGGIAGTSCAQQILTYSTDVKVILIAASDIIKTAVTEQKITKLCSEIKLEESSGMAYQQCYDNLTVVVGLVTLVNANDKYCELSNGTKYNYDKLCICTGAIPNCIVDNNPHVISLRDTDTVKQLIEKISHSKRIIIIGNGGIALELVYELKFCEVYWCIKDDYIGSTFLDKGASAFLLPQLQETTVIPETKSDQLIFKRKRYKADREEFTMTDDTMNATGSALGPDWCSNYQLKGLNEKLQQRTVHIEYNCGASNIFCKDSESNEWNVYVELSNKKVIGADVIISATGVKPNISFNIVSNKKLELTTDKFIDVDNNMQTNIKDIYAAGDICNPTWPKAPNWFQMKLWTQALQLGAYAGQCIVENFNDSLCTLDFCFELFAHATSFFGFKVILLGNYNLQNLNKSDCKILLRCTENVEYIKLILMNGRIQGAVLIGETDLEETFENLILNQTDVDFLGESLLDPHVDIEDYFD